MWACPRQPCFGFGAQLKRNPSQKSPKDNRAAHRNPPETIDGLTHLPGQHLLPGDNPHGQGLRLEGWAVI
nr:LOW QUALITY PROTEIN: uncharacterized protein LOC108065403 [Drosophila takahashii]